MAKFAPVYMSVYDGPEGVLEDLVLSPATFVENSAEDAAIGTFTGMMDASSTISLSDDGGGAVKLDGDDLVVGATPTAVGTLNIKVTETNVYGANSPHETEIAITVTGA